ncbi:MAG: PHP domain-containing protein [Deltaproteobacteria bacterium]|nr:MAG: PHP domain-containing protein [Deltaproteobacteria bacterium]
MTGCEGARRILLVCATSALACASLPMDLRHPTVAPRERPLVAGRYTDYRGAIHVHSHFSHDSEGRIEDIVAAANATGLDFVIMTDHITRDSVANGPAGVHGDTLFIPGGEMHRGGGSILGIGMTRYVERKRRQPQQIIDDVVDQGALALIGYPEGFHEWQVTGYVGIEIYNLKSDVLDEWKLPGVLSFLLLPPRQAFGRIVDRPAEPLARWDRMLRERPLVGVVGSDAHANIRILGRTFGSYHQVFQLFTNHLLARSRSQEDLLEALASGRAYSSFDVFGYVSHFAFTARDGERVALMGESIALGPELRGEVRIPERAEVHLLRDGELEWVREGEVLRFPIARPGVHRVEVYKRGRLWILSNPIYVSAVAADASSGAREPGRIGPRDAGLDGSEGR